MAHSFTIIWVDAKAHKNANSSETQRSGFSVSEPLSPKRVFEISGGNIFFRKICFSKFFQQEVFRNFLLLLFRWKTSTLSWALYESPYQSKRAAVEAQRQYTRLWEVMGSIPAGAGFFLLFLSLSSVSLVRSREELQLYWVALTKNGCAAVQVCAKQVY